MAKSGAFSPHFIFLASLLFLQTMPPTSADSSRNRSDYRIASFKLVSPGVGWAALVHNSGGCSSAFVTPSCPPMRLYWTEDNGSHWRNITPPNMETRNISDVFFLDHAHGWFLSSDPLSEEPDASFLLFSTEDAGKSWRTLILHLSTFGLSDDYTFPTQLFFSDSQHGWMLWHWHLMNSSVDYLLSTSDGGRTWNRLPDAPGSGPIQFTSPTDGWTIGMSKEDVGIPSPDNDALFATHDGGKHWSEISISSPANMDAGSTELVSLQFKNQRIGTVLVSEQFSDGHFVSTVCATRDGGKSWRLFAGNGAPQTISLLDSGQIRAYYDPDDHSYGNLHIQNGNHIISPKMPRDIPLNPGYSFPIFLDRSNGWMSTGSKLLATTDGGKSFRVILPSLGEPEWFPPPQILEVNGIRQVGLSGDEKNRQPVVAGSLMILHGLGFLTENTIWLDAEISKARSDDGETLRITVPSQLTTGMHSLHIENDHGKSDRVDVFVCGLGRPRILEIYTGVVDVSGNPVAHRGSFLSVRGCSFLAVNRVSFEGQAEVNGIQVMDQNVLRVDVPATLARGIYEIYVTNENGSSNSVSVIVD